MSESTASDGETTSSATGTEVGINSYLNLRTGAGTDYKIIGKLENGTEVEIISEELELFGGYGYSGEEPEDEYDDEDYEIDEDDADVEPV